MTGVELIAAERERQQSTKGFSVNSDVIENGDGELAFAAACYCDLAAYQGENPNKPISNPRSPMGWPWPPSWWKPSADPTRNLAKAGALIAAEIDRYATMTSLTRPVESADGKNLS